MSNYPSKYLVITAFLLVLLPGLMTNWLLGMGTTWWVDDDTCPAMGAGTVVDPFCTIQDAICGASSGDVVRVLPGTYQEAIRMRPGVSVIAEDPDPAMTVIDGAGQPCNDGTFCAKRSGNQCSVVTFASGHTPATRIEGFTITGGAGLLPLAPSNPQFTGGGGVYVFSSATVIGNVITNNVLQGPPYDYRGAGIYISAGSPLITNNVISNNISIPTMGNPSFSSGAGIWVGVYSSPMVVGNTIINNVSGDPNVPTSLGSGGGISVFPGVGMPGPVIDRNLIAGNFAEYRGGGLELNLFDQYGALGVVTNNTIVGNTAIGDGGGVLIYLNKFDVINNTITDNIAFRGGGVFMGRGDVEVPVKLSNNIIEGNHIFEFGVGGGVVTIDLDPNSDPTIEYNDLYGNESPPSDPNNNQIVGDRNNGDTIGVDGNFSDDPLFVDPMNDDFHLDANSPAIDMANASVAPPEDGDEVPRGIDGDGMVNSPEPGDVDVGAFEFNAGGGCTPLAPDDATCDSVDDDCDGLFDEDYFSAPTSCGIGGCASSGMTSCFMGTVEDSCMPGAPDPDDATCDGIDDDCDGVDDENYASIPTSCGVGACAGNAGATSCVAGAVEDSCDPFGGAAPDDTTCDAFDDDCDGVDDDDFASSPTACGVGACVGNAGVTTCAAGTVEDTCDPFAGAAPSDATCDAVDDDCDGVDDEDYSSVPTSCGVGACAGNAGTTSCVAGTVEDSCDPLGGAAPEDTTCDGIDDDCDGIDDENYASIPTSCGVGACAGNAGATSCVAGTVEDTCDPFAGAAPSDATCDAVDDDCDGIDDEDYASSPTSCGVGECQASGATSCAAGTEIDSCTPADPGNEICDGLDNNCDGLVDDGFLDTDGDSLADCIDPDDDNDLALDVVDCAPLDETAYGLPGEVVVMDVTGVSPTSITYEMQDLGSGTHYEIVSGLVSRVHATGGFSESFCLTGSTAGGQWFDSRQGPVVGDVWFYELLAANACGRGTLGTPALDAEAADVCPMGIVDGDSDGSPATLDCDDANPARAPILDEICDSIDNDCDSVADEGIDPQPSTCGVGVCASTGTLTCTPSGLEDTCVPGTPAAEVCDGLDNDCNAVTDDGYPDTDGDSVADCVDQDDDNDGAIDTLDCAPFDGTVSGVPFEVTGVQVGTQSPTEILFAEQDIGSATLYEVATGEILDVATVSFGDGSCLASLSGSPAVDGAADPAPGTVRYYLVKSVNTCGPGTFGSPDRDLLPACP